MIFFDTTSTSRWRHSSGLARVSRRLLDELGPFVTAATWPEIVARAGRDDWVLTPELFSEAERPGVTAFVERKRCRIAAIYHDSIPLRLPSVTWPASVARHPSYLKLLSRFDRVWAVSKASRRELLGIWNWQGVDQPPPVDVLALGADLPGIGRQKGPRPKDPVPARIVCVGILEPRKNQETLIDACLELRTAGLDFELHLAGRVNPHFGRPIARKLRELSRAWPGLVHHPELGDAELAGLVGGATATAFPSRAEGCGLPVLESLWLGVPCVCSDIAPVAESAEGGGCLTVRGNASDGWREALRAMISDAALRGRLSDEARGRLLPTWSGAARALLDALGGPQGV
jgi:glycosyltransferase involved in cell wall biosynthesis